jgi:hypothetical protein
MNSNNSMTARTRVSKNLIVLPLAAMASASWAQTVTYGVPVGPATQTMPAMLNHKQVTTGCLAPNTGMNGTVTQASVTTLPVYLPWQVQVGAVNNTGLFGPDDPLPTRLQPSSVVVLTSGVSQSSGQSYTSPTETAITDGGRFQTSTMTYTYGASVAGASFSETFKGARLFDNDTNLLDRMNEVRDYAITSVYDITKAQQVFSSSSIDNYFDDYTTGDVPAGCHVATTDTISATDTQTLSTAPAILISPLLPPAVVGTHYSAQLVTGGKPAGGPYSIIYADGLPPGLTLNADGTLTGSPTAPASGSQTYNPVIYVSDATEVGSPATSQITVTAPASQTCLPPAPPALAAGESWYQLDPAWANLPYDSKQSSHSETGPHTTIGDRGDLLTALAYMLSSAGIPYTPATLDTAIGQHNADFSWAVPPRVADGGGILIGTAVLDASIGYPSAASSGVGFARDKLGSQLTTDLDNYLCTTSVPVLLQVNDPASNYRHYVVATEKASDGYHIIDPGFKARTNLSAYGGKFRIVGVLSGPGHSSATSSFTDLEVDIVDSATLQVYTPQAVVTGMGGTTGDPRKGSPDAGYLTIDNAVDSDAGSIQPTSTTYMVGMTADTTSKGLYTIQVTGLHLGVYYLTVKTAGSLNALAVTPGLATLGSKAAYLVRLDAPNHTLHLTRQASFATAFQDVTLAQDTGAISAADATTLTGFLTTAQKATTAGNQAQRTTALNAFNAKAKTGHSPDVVNVLTGDVDTLLASPTIAN